MKTHNPMLNKDFIWNRSRDDQQNTYLTANGATTKAALLVLITFFGAGISWTSSIQSGVSMGLGFMGAIAGFILALITTFKPTIAFITAPLYAVFEGLFLGAIAYYFETIYPGIASQAMLGTLSVFMVMMLLYQTKIIQVTDRLRSIIVAATLGIFVAYLISFVLSFFMPISIFRGGVLGIIFSAFIIIVAAFNLLLDFDLIEKSEKNGAPKYMEWYCAFALLVTLVWLYLEILRLFSYLRQE